MMSKSADFPFGANEKSQALCMALDAIVKLDKEKADYLREYKESRESLWEEVRRLKFEIQTGQMSLIEVAEKSEDQKSKAAGEP